MLEDKLARVRKLMAERDKIDAELSAMFGMAASVRRGRPRKDQGSTSSEGVSISHSEGVSWPSGQSTGNGSDAE